MVCTEVLFGWDFEPEDLTKYAPHFLWFRIQGATPARYLRLQVGICQGGARRHRSGLPERFGHHAVRSASEHCAGPETPVVQGKSTGPFLPGYWCRHAWKMRELAIALSVVCMDQPVAREGQPSRWGDEWACSVCWAGLCLDRVGWGARYLAFREQGCRPGPVFRRLAGRAAASKMPRAKVAAPLIPRRAARGVFHDDSPVPLAVLD